MSNLKGFLGQLKGDGNSFGKDNPGYSNSFNQQIVYGLEDLLAGAIGIRASRVPRVSQTIKNQKAQSRANRMRTDLLSPARLDQTYESRVLAFPKTYFRKLTFFQFFREIAWGNRFFFSF